jgi:hypothetical protein
MASKRAEGKEVGAHGPPGYAGLVGEEKALGFNAESVN